MALKLNKYLKMIFLLYETLIKYIKKKNRVKIKNVVHILYILQVINNLYLKNVLQIMPFLNVQIL